jgi:hypothetical protein
MPPRPSLAKGSGASLVQRTKPSGEGEPLATPRVNGEAAEVGVDRRCAQPGRSGARIALAAPVKTERRGGFLPADLRLIGWTP